MEKVNIGSESEGAEAFQHAILQQHLLAYWLHSFYLVLIDIYFDSSSLIFVATIVYHFIHIHKNVRGAQQTSTHRAHFEMNILPVLRKDNEK